MCKLFVGNCNNYLNCLILENEVCLGLEEEGGVVGQSLEWLGEIVSSGDFFGQVKCLTNLVIFVKFFESASRMGDNPKFCGTWAKGIEVFRRENRYLEMLENLVFSEAEEVSQLSLVILGSLAKMDYCFAEKLAKNVEFLKKILTFIEEND